MNGPKREFVKTKIAGGYMLLIAACILSVGCVYRTVVRFSAPDAGFGQLHRKRGLVSRTLYHLYLAESSGQLMIAGYTAYERRYRDELRTVRACLDSLRGLASGADSLQTMRMDSIAGLIADKERRTMNLHRSIRAAGSPQLLDRNIGRMLERDTLVASDTVSAAAFVQTDTVAVPHEKRRFFRRLADLFSPPKADSDIVISRREVVETPAAAVKDTIETVLRALQDSVSSERRGIYAQAWREALELRSGNERIDATIYRLIMDFEEEETACVMRNVDRRELLLRRSSAVLGSVAVAAVLLVLLFVAILWRDINRSNRYRRELERANREKEALLAAREQLMLAITHDIKAPLGSVMGYIDLLQRLTEERRGRLYLEYMKEASEHLLALVNSLLEYYRLDIDKAEVHEVVFNPARLFETIRAGFAAQAAARGLDLRLETEPGAAQRVTGDAFRIRRIADNLISNALKFTDRGSVTVRADVVQGRLVFSVSDTGRGIAPEERERIFGEFVRLRSARGVEGFGLGLSIVDRTVRLLRGTVTLESRPGGGSRFFVSVPVGGAPAECASEPELPARTPVPERTLRILLVDDDPLQLEMTASMCRNAGIETENCSYPEYAGRIVAGGRFDAVLTDIQMPSADGFAVLEAVHAVDPLLPVVAVSARGELRDGAFAERGFAACLRKPFTCAELLAAIGAACGASPGVSCGGGSVPERSGGAAADFGALTAFAGGDAEAEREIMQTFAAETEANGIRFRTALAERDFAALKSLAHKMLPIFTMLGAVESADVLRRIDTCPGEPDGRLLREAETLPEKISALVAEAQKMVSLRRYGADIDRR